MIIEEENSTCSINGGDGSGSISGYESRLGGSGSGHGHECGGSGSGSGYGDGHGDNYGNGTSF